MPAEKITAIISERVTKPRAPLSHAVRLGDLIFVSGTTPRGEGGVIAPDFATQMRQVMTNIAAILEDAGSSLEQVVKMNVILTRKSDFEEMNTIYREHFPNGVYPARTTVVCELAVPGLLLEIECVAQGGPQ